MNNQNLLDLPYVNISERQDLDNISILYIDGDNALTAKIISNTYQVEKLDDIKLLIEKLFINKVKTNNQVVSIENGDLISTINKYLNAIDTERKNVRKRVSEELFFMVPKGFDIAGYETVQTEYLQDEIIFGYRTEIDEPGILLLTNSDALKDKNNIKLSLCSIGFFPDKSYCILKIK